MDNLFCRRKKYDVDMVTRPQLSISHQLYTGYRKEGI